MIDTLIRYPVKSMLGERLDRSRVSDRGLDGDRRWALLDRETGRVVSAKYARRWGRTLTLSARLGSGDRPEVRLPDGRWLPAGAPETDEVLSALLGRPVTLTDVAPADLSIDRVDPLVEGERVEVDHERAVRSGTIAEGAPAGTFFDYAPLHLVTRATMQRLAELAPDATIADARFRPNIVLDLPDEPFAENAWTGRVLRLGQEVEVQVGLPAPRCAIPTLAQPGLPADPGVFRALARHNRIPVPDMGIRPCLGIYGHPLTSGTLAVGDVVEVAG
jgi:uncharacterized protein YcbX